MARYPNGLGWMPSPQLYAGSIKSWLSAFRTTSSKSITASKPPRRRIQSLTVLRMAGFAGSQPLLSGAAATLWRGMIVTPMVFSLAALSRFTTSSSPAITWAAPALRRMSFVPSNTITCVAPARCRTSRSSRSIAVGLLGGGTRLSRVTVLPPMPSLTMPRSPRPASSRRSATTSSQRSCASSVAHVPSVMESPNATIVPFAVSDSTSIDDTRYIEVVVRV